MTNPGMAAQTVSQTDGNWRRYDAELKFYEHIKNDILREAEAAGMSPQQEFNLELGIEEMFDGMANHLIMELPLS